MGPSYPRLYGTGTGADVRIPLLKRGVVDFAVSADWTPAAGDVKVSKDGGTAANIATLPTALTMGNTALWVFVFSDAELQCKELQVTVADAATKAVEDQSFSIDTYGHASAKFKADLSAANLPANTLQFGGTTVTARDLGASVLLTSVESNYILSSTGSSGTTTTLTLSAGASSVDQYYRGMLLEIAGGANLGVGRYITNYAGSTKVATWIDALPATPDAAPFFTIRKQRAPALGADGGSLLSNGTGTGQVKLAAGYISPNWGDVGSPTTTVALTGTTVGTATNLTNAPTAGDLTATMKTSVTTAATAATPIAASVTGSVGSVTGNVGGNVTGSVASVTGAVGSVTGSVGSVATGGIAAASFAAGAITAAAIATDAIGAAELAADAITEIQAGLSTLTAAGVRAAVGLASANLDTQLDALPTAAENADQVWDEVLSGHLTAGSTGFALNAAGGAGDPWSTALPGAYGAGSAGKIVGDNLNATVSSRLASASYTAPDNATIGTMNTKLGTPAVTVSADIADLPTNAELATALAAADDAVLLAIANLNNLASGAAMTLTSGERTAIANAVNTTVMTESYAADGATMTQAQALYMLWAFVQHFTIVSTAYTSKKLDGTTAMVHTLDSATTPTAIDRTT